ncbi:MAG: CRISPR-associated protein Cas4 [Bacilli bacterium]|nr:CRISPR-associated protein Cas4 [Bacilli bacterium]
MKDYKEEDYLMLSSIQHYAFCPRQWALIDVELAWKENVHTIMGNIFHEKAHSGNSEKRNNIIISRSLPIQSRTLGISGECDVVEFHLNENGVKLKGREEKYIPCPIEYKKGKPKVDDIDILQLTAQAMCLEEMFCTDVKIGYLFYGITKRREKIEITEELKNKVFEIYTDMHNLIERGNMPKVKITKKCDQCSLKDLCLPRLNLNISAKSYIEKNLKEEEV